VYGTIFAIMEKTIMTDYKKLAGASINSLTAYKPGKPVAELKRELGLDKIIKMASNENPYGPSPHVKDAVKSGLDDIFRYPLGDAFDIRMKVAAKYDVSPDELTFGTGSNELIELMMRTFIHGGETVMSPAPSFSVYGLTATAMGTKCDWVPVNSDFKTDMDELLSKITPQTRIVFLANPNNPLGNYITATELTYFMDKVPSDVIVAMDEAYIEFADAADIPDTLAMRRKYGNMILLRTFSKAYGLAGLRIGYAIAPRDATDMMNRVRQPFNTNSLAQIGAYAAIDDVEWLKRVVALNAECRRQLYAGFERLGLPYVKSQANFILVNVKDGKGVFERLLRQGVIVRYMGDALKPYVRVSVGTKEENEIFLAALAKVL